jgi:hypothetical protein
MPKRQLPLAIYLGKYLLGPQMHIVLSVITTLARRMGDFIVTKIRF